MLLIINYHYIRDINSYDYPGIHPVSTPQFENQLMELSRHLDFIEPSELNRLVLSQSVLTKNYGLVTFDDGLREQFEQAVPILDRLKIPAIFFINTLPLIAGTVLSVHKLHWLRATRPPEIFIHQLSEALDHLGFELADLGQDDSVSSMQYLYDDLETRRLKFLINHRLPGAIRDSAIDFMFKKDQDEAGYGRQLYMSRDQVYEIARAHAVGSHTHSHQSLATLDFAHARSELIESKLILENITQKVINAISYPYGGTTTINNEILQVARTVGYEMGFTMERSLNRSLVEPLMLARISTSDAPGGNRPLVDYSSGSLELTLPMQESRLLEKNQSEDLP